MHPKILERRGRVLSAVLTGVDLDIRSASASIGRRVRLAGGLCVSEEEAAALEALLRTSVDCVLDIPSATDSGRRARRELILRLIELDDYLDGLLRKIESAAKPAVGDRHSFARSLHDLNQLADAGAQAVLQRNPA